MYAIKYILVNDRAAKGSAYESRHRFIPHIGHCIVLNASSKWQVPGSSERAALIDQLCKLRRHHPDAPILGVSELPWDGPSTGSGTVSSHAPVRVSDAMNALRRELCDLP